SGRAASCSASRRPAEEPPATSVRGRPAEEPPATSVRGRPAEEPPATSARGEPVIDRALADEYLPAYDVVMRHAVRVPAPAPAGLIRHAMLRAVAREATRPVLARPV